MNGRASDPSAPAPTDRLDSWKEVASYLRRDESTVRRWEKTEGLPVHRHVHDQRSSVFAYRHELDAWLEGRGVDTAHAPKSEAHGEAPDGGTRRPSMRRWASSVAIGSAVVLLLWGASRSTPSRVPAAPYRVLIAGSLPSGRTALYDMLEREITKAPGLEVVPRGEISDTLRLMRRDATSEIDDATATEIALRRGDVDGVLQGGLEHLDGSDRLVLSLRDPVGGGLVAAWQEAAPDGDLRVSSTLGQRIVRELTAHLRSLERNPDRGEPFKGMDGMALEPATTSSFKAWRLYADAMTLHFAFRWRESAELLERAVAEDPDFAMAHAFLGRAYTSLGQAEKAVSSYERAFELADAVSDRERYFIRASYFEHVLQDPRQASDAYSTLLVTYPDHYWGVTYASWFHFRHGGIPQVTEYLARYADLRPEHLEMTVQAAFALSAWGNSPDYADRLVARARNQLPGLTGPVESFDRLGTGNAAWVALYEVYRCWYQGDVRGALDRLRHVSGQAHSRFSPWVGRAYLALGRLEDAERVFTSLSPDDIHRHEGLLGVALARGTEAALRRYLADIGPRPFDWIAVLRVRENMYSPDPLLVDRYPDAPGARVVLGTAALRDGRTDEAIATLEAVLPRLSEEAEEPYYLALESLALAWQQKGDRARAAEALEVTRGIRAQAAFGANYRPLLWMQSQAHLAALYRELGRDRDAEALESDLANLLSVADADHILLSGS